MPAAQLYQDAFDAMADLMNAAADAADALRAEVANATAQVVAAINAVRAYVDQLIGTTAISDFAWATAGLAAAKAELDAWIPDNDAVDDAMNAATAINAAVLHLRATTPRTVATFAIGVATGVEEVVAACLWAIADFFDRVADYIRSAGVSHAQAARDSVRLSHAWIALVGAPSITLHNLNAVATAAVNTALDSAANALAAQQDAVSAYTQYVDPVVDLLAVTGAEALNAGLISDGALDFQVRQRLAADTADTPFTVILSPAPLFGHWLVEVAQKMMTLTFGDAELTENEPWSGNLRAYHRALRALAPLGSAVVVSGDVHYAFSTVNDFSGPGWTRRPLRPADVVGGQERDEHHDEARRSPTRSMRTTRQTRSTVRWRSSGRASPTSGSFRWSSSSCYPTTPATSRRHGGGRWSC